MKMKFPFVCLLYINIDCVRDIRSFEPDPTTTGNNDLVRMKKLISLGQVFSLCDRISSAMNNLPPELLSDLEMTAAADLAEDEYNMKDRGNDGSDDEQVWEVDEDHLSGIDIDHNSMPLDSPSQPRQIVLESTQVATDVNRYNSDNVSRNVTEQGVALNEMKQAGNENQQEIDIDPNTQYSEVCQCYCISYCTCSLKRDN